MNDNEHINYRRFKRNKASWKLLAAISFGILWIIGFLGFLVSLHTNGVLLFIFVPAFIFFYMNYKKCNARVQWYAELIELYLFACDHSKEEWIPAYEAKLLKHLGSFPCINPNRVRKLESLPGVPVKKGSRIL